MSQDPRSRKRADTNRRIYLTAMRLFQERGFEEVSVGEIAAAAGVSVPTFYAHFPSKEHIVLPMPTAEEIQALLTGQPVHLPVAERVRGAILTFFSLLQGAERAEVLERWQIVVTTPHLRNRAAEFERATASLVLDALPTEVKKQSATDPDLVVTLSLSAYTQILMRWAEAGGSRELEDVAEEVLAVLRRL
ncbi:MAG TPA: TetR/AcrR family transcriptional regulator [Geodermatophilus sp.]|nr:TetR/AcrR family transcriptional regulator [Geodermatophilus sp.]